MKSLNIPSVLNIIGMTLMLESLFIWICIAVSFYFNDGMMLPLFQSFLIVGLSGSLLYALTHKCRKHELSVKDSFLVVTFSWLCIGLLGAIPYWITHSIPRFVDALFESISGFSTTGSSILNDIEAMPQSLLFWRALTHWMGGMGIIVLVIAILPKLEIAGSNLFVAEGSFMGIDKIKPRLIDVAKRLWVIYVILTLVETILLRLAGMGWFDSLCHSFATIATGGFSTKNTSLIEQSALIQYIVIFFMVVSGINFSLHYLAFHGKMGKVVKNEELQGYLGIILGVSVLIAWHNHSNYATLESSFRHALFQVSSIITATGFASADYEKWTTFSMTLIFATMFIGASSGSTGGGIKVVRYIIMIRGLKQRFTRLIKPNGVRLVKYNQQVIDQSMLLNVTSFVFIYFATWLVGSFIMLLIGVDFQTATSSVITTLGGIGPGFGSIGPVENFASIPDLGKLYLSFNMILGRLEIMSVLALFSPSFYKV